MERKTRNHTCENSHLSLLRTASQATRGVSNENGLRQARHMALVDLVCLV